MKVSLEESTGVFGFFGNLIDVGVPVHLIVTPRYLAFSTSSSG